VYYLKRFDRNHIRQEDTTKNRFRSYRKAVKQAVKQAVKDSNVYNHVDIITYNTYSGREIVLERVRA
jgi:hypothetical protein